MSRNGKNKVKAMRARTGAMIRGYEREAEEIRAGAVQQRRIYDATITGLVLTLGDRHEDGSISVIIPKINVADMLAHYELRARVLNDGTRELIAAPVEQEGKDVSG